MATLTLKKPIVVKPIVAASTIPAAIPKAVALKKKTGAPKKAKIKELTPRKAQYKIIKTWLYETFPNTFSNEKKPLKIGITKDILAILPLHFEATELAKIKKTLRWILYKYCDKSLYHQNIIEGTSRIDLKGLVVSEISEHAKEHAKERMNAFAKRNK